MQNGHEIRKPRNKVLVKREALLRTLESDLISGKLGRTEFLFKAIETLHTVDSKKNLFEDDNDV